MAWWRTLLKVICSILLVASIILCMISFSASTTLSYGSLKPMIADAIKQSMPEANETQIMEEFDEIYYKQYDCALIDCIAESQDEGQIMVLASEHAAKSFKAYSNYFLIAIFVLILIIILISDPKYNFLATLGIDFTAAGGLPLMAIMALKSKMPTGAEAQLITQLITSLTQYFIITLIAGIAILLIAKPIARKMHRKKKAKAQEEEEE